MSLKPFGPFQIAAIEAGTQKLDGGAMFGVVPRTLWSHLIAPDERHRIPLALRCLYLQSADRKIVIDTGIGDKFSAKLNDIYGVTPAANGLRGELAAHGVDYREVTDVILTHLHFDHAGGATQLAADGVNYEPTFPHARYHLQKSALAWAKAPTEKDRASFRPHDWQVLETSGCLNLLEGNQELFDGISLIVSNGHSIGQQLVLVDGQEAGKLLYCGDAIPTSAHVPLAYIMGYDLQPLVMIEEKRALLERAVKERWILFYEHDPLRAATYVAQSDGKYAAAQEFVF